MNFYAGVVEGDPNSIVSLSEKDGTINMLVQSQGKSYNFSQAQGLVYNLIREDKIDRSGYNFCSSNTENANTELSGRRIGLKEELPCVKVYFEVDFDAYQRLGTVEKASEYFLAAFNEVNTLYKNENINVQISELFVWDIPSPYLGFGSLSQLQQFQVTRPVFNGDIAHLVDFRTNNGGVAYVDVLCSNSAYAYSGCEPSFETYPTYSWTVEVITHEIGHNLGSPHTHDCSWPGGAIDDCAVPQGSCDRGPMPVNGGTIMSYCHLTHHGINFANGFGTLPGDLIRDRVAGAACLETCELLCLIPSALQQTNSSQNSFTVQWTPNSGAKDYTFAYRLFGTNDWTILFLDQSFVTIDGLLANREYETMVRGNCNDTLSSEFSNIVRVTTGVMPNSYCESFANNSSSEWIQTVALGSFSRTTGNNSGYGDFTSTQVELSINKNINYTLTPGFTGGLLGPNRYPEYWKIWIDLNRDGDFLDAGELVMDPGKTSDQTISGTFVIPATTPGISRMRISMKYNAAAGPCENFQEGEVEDYSVFLVDGTTSVNNIVGEDFQIYPNPTKNIIKVDGVLGKQENYSIYNSLGQKVLEGSFSGNENTATISLETLQKGSYILQLPGGKSFRIIKI